MIKSKTLLKYKEINHGFFNKKGGVSTGIYKSLNCGSSSNDNKKNINKNLNITFNNKKNVNTYLDKDSLLHYY